MGGLHEGGCVCGALRYRVRGEPVLALACHCTFCQRRLGSAFSLEAFFHESSVEITQGEPKTYEHYSDESRRWLRMQFCPHCGTTVAHTLELRPGMIAIAVGTLDDSSWIVIGRHVWVRSKRPWLPIPAEVAVFPKGSTG